MRMDGVYPRACGGTNEQVNWRSTETGLSPRLRGNPAMLMSGDAVHGSIPAPAGEPTPGTGSKKPTWVYPRACGETAVLERRLDCPQGLSPRLRGNRTFTQHRPAR